MSNKPLIKIFSKRKGDPGAKPIGIAALWPPDRGPYYGATLDREVARIVLRDGTEITAETHFLNVYVDGPVTPLSEPRAPSRVASARVPDFSDGGVAEDDIPF